MKTKIMMLVVALCLFAGNASAQWAVIDPTNLAQGIVNTTKEIAQTSKIVGNTVDTFKETKKFLTAIRKSTAAQRRSPAAILLFGFSDTVRRSCSRRRKKSKLCMKNFYKNRLENF